MWVYSFLLLRFVVSNAVIIFPPSPCPKVFNYEDDSTDGDRWYGELTINPITSVVGLSLRIALDRPSHLLAFWNNEVSSTDNQIYLANDDEQRIDARTNLTYKMMVKFDQDQRYIPFLSTVHFNGRRICPPDDDAPLTLTAGDSNPNQRPDGQRPDPVFTEPTDVLSDKTRTSIKIPVSPPPKSYPCGIVEQATPLITHGLSTLRGQWPWHVALYQTEGANLNYKCGATLVAKNKVLTAAHCVTTESESSEIIRKPINASQLILYLGKHRLHHYSSEEGIQTKQVSKIVVHSGYNADNYYGDLAVLTLSSDVEYSNYVRPVCLWEAVSNTDDIEGKEGSVVGWGLNENERTTEDLKVARLPVVSTETCLRSFPQFYSKFTSNATFCAGFRNGKVDTEELCVILGDVFYPVVDDAITCTSPCNGDSGGGIVFNRNGAWYLRGIVSLSVAKEGFNFCDSNYYVIFTDLGKFGNFLQRYLNDY